MYEVKMHIQEVLDVGAIQPFNSPWASAGIKERWEIKVLY